MCCGAVGTHPLAEYVREQARSADLRHESGLRHVPTRVYRYGRHRWTRPLTTIFLLAMALGMLAIGIALPATIPGTFSDKIALALPGCGFGLFLVWYTVRWRQLCIRTTAEGLEARLYFRTTTIPWNAILVLIAREHHTRTGPLVTIYSVYSQHDKISFTNRLDGCEELVDLLAQTTNQEWQ